ncbi:MAG: DsbA family protein [Paracoccaceae bacterium]
MIISIWAICMAVASNAHEDDVEFEERIRAFLLKNPEVILEAMTSLAEREKTAAQSQAIATFPDIFTEIGALGMGDVAAPIRVVEFFDYRCAPCKAMHPGLVSLVNTTPELRIEMRQLPILSPASERGARFALAVKEVAGLEAYGRVHERLWQLRGPLNAASFEKVAREETLDWTLIKELMNSDAVSARIDRNRDIAIALEILGTPAFVSTNSITFGQSDINALAEVWLNQ